jgi:predicted MFS family arabinose efflux permease
MAFYSLGVGLGAAIGITIGGTVATYYGWRAAMYVIGLPGLLLALIIWAVVPEPKRGLSDAQVAMDTPKPRFAESLTGLLRTRPALHLIMGFTLTSMIGYGQTAFGPSYLQRSFGFTKLDIAWEVAPIAAVAILVGALGSGRIADRLGQTKGLYAQSLMVAGFKICALPFTVLFFSASNPTVALGAYLASLFFTSCYLGPTFSLIQGQAPVRERAMWAAITLLVNNLIGLGLGPPLVGAVSVMLKPYYGAESLRYAMFILAAITPWAIFHYWRAGVLLSRTERFGRVATAT